MESAGLSSCLTGCLYGTTTKRLPGFIYFPCQTREEAERYIGEADILFGSTSFPGDVLKKGSNLQWIQVIGAGAEQFALSSISYGF